MKLSQLIMKLSHFACPALALLTALPLHAADPVVANVVPDQRTGTKLVDISFDVSDADSDTLSISVEISDDSGTTFLVPVTGLSGDISVAATPTLASQYQFDPSRNPPPGSAPSPQAAGRARSRHLQ